MVRVIVNMISAKLGWSGGQRRPPGLVGTKEELTVSILVPNGGRQIDWGSDRAHFVLLILRLDANAIVVPSLIFSAISFLYISD